jgi:peptidoglycan/xylan/chitin deacetylase (PgdA/CDA1 family)
MPQRKKKYKLPKTFSRKHILFSILITAFFSSTLSFLLANALLHGFTVQASSMQEYTELNQTLDGRLDINPFIKEQVILHGPRNKKEIALTFDAEMTEAMKENYLSGRVKSSYDDTIITILNQTQTEATLFLTGMWIELYPSVVATLSANPLFELGSHSYADTSYAGYCYGLPSLPNTLHIEDIGATEKLLREVAHIDNRLFRFPGGCYTENDVKLVGQTGDMIVHWDVEGDDGFNSDAWQIAQNVINHVQNGSIILLHMNGAPTAPKTAEALPIIIQSLKEKGYTFVKVSELLGLPAQQTGN